MPLPDCKQIEAWLAAREAKVPHLREGCAKRIVWADTPGVPTPVSVLYIHGFSATGEELRPLPDLVANALGANLYFTRLTGHGQDGAALGAATLEAWQADVSEALEVAQVIGGEVIVMACSTGCTLTTLALAGGKLARGVVQISPNFGLRNKFGQRLLDLPGARHYGHLIAGRERAFPVLNAAHGRYWTARYPISAVYPMADAVRAVRRADLSRINVPALFAFNAADQVIDPKRAHDVMRKWGGPVAHIALEQREGDDAMGHVMAGDVFSPGQTRPLAAQIIAWAEAQ